MEGVLVSALMQKISLRDEKGKLDTGKEELVSMRFHPLWELKPVTGMENEHAEEVEKLKWL